MKAFIAVATLALVAVANGQLGGGGGLGGRGIGGGAGGLGGGIGYGGGYGGGHGHDHHHHHDHHAYPAYKYSYGVADKHTGDVKSASEVRDGHITKGSYSLVQPDGVLRTVNYIVDPKGGFQAQVLNKGVAGHPHIHHHHSHHGHHGHGGLGGGLGGGIGGGIVG